MKLKIAAFILAFLIIVPSVFALTYAQKKDEVFVLAKDKVVEDDVFAVGDRVEIAGKVEGDVYAAAKDVVVTGLITGDLITAGENVTVSGTIGDDLIAAARSINIKDARITGSARVFGLDIHGNDKTTIDETLVFGARTMDIEGTVGRNVVGGASDTAIDAKIGRDVLVGASNFSISEKSSVAGNVTYSAAQNARIEEGADIVGEVKEITPPQTVDTVPAERNAFAGVNLGFRMWSYFAALFAGALLLRFAREFMKKTTQTLDKKMFVSLGWGFVALLLTPPALIMLGFTIIGLPVALFFFILYFFELYASKIIVGVWVGEIINTKMKQKSDNVYLKFALGLLVVYIASMLPVISFFASLFTLLAGLGAIVISKKETFLAKK